MNLFHLPHDWPHTLSAKSPDETGSLPSQTQTDIYAGR
jgi:hypothetical protein